MPTKLALKIELPDGIVQQYDDQNEHARPVEELMAQRLVNCVDHNAVRGLYFDDAQRGELESLVGVNLQTTAEAMTKLRQMVTVKVNGVDVQLDQTVLKRAEGRAQAMRLTIEEWLAKEITVAMEFAVGLR